ncbi:MAG: PEP-CTERM sorting domain-containing protein [Akkermansia sp.]|nr:PEP-CTERM sorting domain-containing protein [Akkermansia sp.]
MKLHLPKLLSIAVMSALALPTMGAAFTSADIVTPIEGGDSYLDVGTNRNDITHTWSGDLVIGDTDESTGDVTNVGAFDDSWDWVTPDGTGALYTCNLKVEGNVTVQGNGKVVLGGAFSTTHYKGLEATDRITVNGGSLTATKIIANDLVVNGGTVSTHTDGCNNGTFSINIASTLLQSYIKNSLTINSGELSFGYAGDDIKGIGDNSDRMTTFGDMNTDPVTIRQTGGTMSVYGDMGLKDGAAITQEGGTMVLRDTVWMDFSGTTTFNQSADKATLVIGRLESAKINNIHNIEFNQSGDGLIHLAYGSNFAKESTVSLNQTGNGVINIGGGHDTALTGALPTNYALDQTTFESNNTTYNIDQSGAGTVNVNGALTADTVKVSGESKLNLNEDVSVNTLTQSEKAEITVAKDKTLAVNGLTISGGVFANNGTINGVVSLAQSAEGESINITDGELVNSGTINASVNMTGGTLVSEAGSEIAGISATGGDILVGGDFTMTGDMMLDGDAELIFADADYTIALGEYDVEFSGNSSIALTLGDADISEVVLFTGARKDTYTGFEVTLLDAEGNSTGTAVMQYNANGDVTLGTAAVPEPTTATLSLLALAALAARRRRR